MRKTPGHNPRGFERNSWNYRVLQLRHALGWSQDKLARVMGVSNSVVKHLETGDTTRPDIETVYKIKKMEENYADILKVYKKAPVRMDRLYRKDRRWNDKWRYGVKLKPIEVRRPEDIETLGKVEADSESMVWGRGSRRRMQQTGLSMRRKRSRAKASAASARNISAYHIKRRFANENNKEVESGQPNDQREGEI